MSLFDQRMTQSTGDMALARARATDCNDVDGFGDKAASAQPLNVRSGGGIEPIELERAEGLIGQQLRLIA